VQRLVAQQFARSDWSRPDNQGCQMVQAQLQLHGWSKARRVVIVRQRIRGGIARERTLNTAPVRADGFDKIHRGQTRCLEQAAADSLEKPRHPA